MLEQFTELFISMNEVIHRMGVDGYIVQIVMTQMGVGSRETNTED